MHLDLYNHYFFHNLLDILMTSYKNDILIQLKITWHLLPKIFFLKPTNVYKNIHQLTTCIYIHFYHIFIFIYSLCIHFHIRHSYDKSTDWISYQMIYTSNQVFNPYLTIMWYLWLIKSLLCIKTPILHMIILFQYNYTSYMYDVADHFFFNTIIQRLLTSYMYMWQTILVLSTCAQLMSNFIHKNSFAQIWVMRRFVKKTYKKCNVIFNRN
jgi:hypothetical protein